MLRLAPFWVAIKVHGYPDDMSRFWDNNGVWDPSAVASFKARPRAAEITMVDPPPQTDDIVRWLADCIEGRTHPAEQHASTEGLKNLPGVAIETTSGETSCSMLSTSA